MFGFEPLQVALMFVGLIFFLIISISLLPPILAVILFVIILFAIIRLGKLLSINNQKGNPDFLNSKFTSLVLPKVIEDKNGVCNYLIKND